MALITDDGSGNLTVESEREEETLVGGGGNDTLTSAYTKALLYGGPGDDVLWASGGESTLDGGEGNDSLLGLKGDYLLVGGAGDDAMEAGMGNSLLSGGVGNDQIFTQLGNHVVWGDEGDDSLTGLNGSSTLHGGEGNDTLAGSDGSYHMYGDAGNDTLSCGHIGPGGDWSTYMDGGDGDDILSDSSSNSTLLGGVGNDSLSISRPRLLVEIEGYPLPGSDTVTSDPSTDGTLVVGSHFMDGGFGDDVLLSAWAGTLMLGGAGNDELITSGAACTLEGGIGDDRLISEGESTTLDGGAGNDMLFGGAYGDRFVFSTMYASKPGKGGAEGGLPPSPPETFTDWLAPQNLSITQLTQGQLSKQYTAWLQHLVATHPGLGADLDGDGVIAIDANPNDPTGLPKIEGLGAEATDTLFSDTLSVAVAVGPKTQIRYLSNTFAPQSAPPIPAVKSGDGHDLIFGFDPLLDTLALRLLDGMTLEQVTSQMQMSSVDTDSDQVNDATYISFKQFPNDWSVTLIGVTGFSIDSVVAA